MNTRDKLADHLESTGRVLNLRELMILKVLDMHPDCKHMMFKNENYTLYGDDGQFILPNKFVNQIKDTQDFKGLSLRI